MQVRDQGGRRAGHATRGRKNDRRRHSRASNKHIIAAREDRVAESQGVGFSLGVVRSYLMHTASGTLTTLPPAAAMAPAQKATSPVFMRVCLTSTLVAAP